MQTKHKCNVYNGEINSVDRFINREHKHGTTPICNQLAKNHEGTDPWCLDRLTNHLYTLG